MTSLYLDSLNRQIDALNREILDLDGRIARLRSQESAARLPVVRERVLKQLRTALRDRSQRAIKRNKLQQMRSAWIAKHPTVPRTVAWQSSAKPSTTPAAALKAGGAKLQPAQSVVAAPPKDDPYSKGVTLASAPQALRFYTDAMRSPFISKETRTYYMKRVTYVQSVLRAAAPHRQGNPAMQAEVARLRRLALAAKARRNYAENLRLQQQIERLEQQLRVSSVSTQWSPTAPESYVAPAMPSNEIVADATLTALTFQQARTKALSPIDDAAEKVAASDAADAADDGASDAGETDVPWYKRFALPLAIAAALGVGVVMFGKKGKGSGKFLLRPHGSGSSKHHTAAA